MIWARIADGVVAEVVDLGDLGLDAYFTPEIAEQWKPATSATEEGGTYVDGVYSPKPVPEAPEIPYYVPVPLARERLEAAGKWDALVGALATDMPKLIKLLTLAEGLSPKDPEVRGVLKAIGADADAILAPPDSATDEAA